MSNGERLKQYWAEVKAGLRPAPKRGEPTGIIKRRIRCASNLVRDGEVILIIYPHGELGLREVNRRTEYKLGLADVWRVAVETTVLKFGRRVKELKKVMTLAQARRQARKELGL